MKKVIFLLLYSGNICHSVTEEVANQSPKIAIQHPIIEKNNIKPKSSYKYIIIGLVCVLIAMILYFTLNNTNTNRKNEIQPNPVPIEQSQSSPADIECQKTKKRNQWRVDFIKNNPDAQADLLHITEDEIDEYIESEEVIVKDVTKLEQEIAQYKMM